MNNKTRIQLSVMMFLQFFIWGSWYVTLGSYLRELGFTGGDIGNIYSTVSLAAIVAPLFVGMIADRFFAAQRVLAVMHLLGGVLLFFVAQMDTSSGVYWTLLLYSLCYMPTLAIVNAVAFYQLTDPETQFPLIRVLGTFGWIIAGFIISGLSAELTATPILLGAGASIVMGIYAFTLPNTPPKAKGEPANIAKLLGLDALQLMKDRSFAILVISSLLISIPLSFYYAFANPFLIANGMENTAAIMGAGGQGTEVLFLFLMPFFFRKLGVKWMIALGMLCWVLRYLFFAFGNGEELIFMFYIGILLHGLCYDFFFVTGQIYVDKAAPEAVRSSAQGLITLVTYGIGMYIGSIVAGQVVDYYTVNDVEAWMNIWLFPAILAAIVLGIFLVLFNEKKQLATAKATTYAGA
ncbi:MAG: nucleoside permease [Bacteroidota bacterium]